MKTIYTFILSILFIATVWAQSPQKMSYQAIVRNQNDQLVPNQAVGMQISILQGSVSGTQVYSETHSTTTNANGLVSIQIGTGETSDDFSAISWKEGPFFLKTEIDPSGGKNYTITGTTQLLSVPFSFYSTTAENVVNEKQTLADVLDNWNDAEGQIKGVLTPTDPQDAVNKEYVTLGISSTGDTLFLGKNQSVIIPGLSASNVKAPAVVTLDAKEISLKESILSGNIPDNGWAEITDYGFEYSTTQGFESGTGTKVNGKLPFTKGNFDLEIDSLTEGETYYFKAFAKNNKGTSYGEEKIFTTFELLNSTSPASEKIAQIIGKGYDITDKYANSSSIKSMVLDYEKMNKDQLICLDQNQLSGAIMAASGSTSSDYQSSLKVSAKIKASYGCFSGEVKGRYSHKTITRDDYSFATESSRQIRTAYFVNKDYLYDLSKLYPYLTDSFKIQIMKLDTATIWSRYGTDVLLGGMWGGRADYNLSVQKHDSYDGKDISAYVSAKYKAVLVSGSGSVDVDKSYADRFVTNSVESQILSAGGNNAEIEGPSDLLAWQKSINDENEVFMEYYPNTVIPIYEFIQDPTRKEAIKRAYEEHLKHYVIPVNSTSIPLPIDQSFTYAGFTQHIAGDKDVNSKSGRNTLVSITITVNKKSSSEISCNISLDVKEQHSDNTEFSGTQEFTITSEKEIKDFVEKKYTSGVISMGGSHHDYVTIPNVNVGWIKNLQVQFDSNNSNDQGYIGIRGTLEFVVQTRSPLE